MSTTTIRYCLNRCTTRSGEQRIPTQVDGRAVLCRSCEDNLEKWLREIPDHYALLPTFALPGSAEKNPDSGTTKAAFVNPPVRLEVIDLLDSRVGRIWNGTAPAHDRRGVIGTLVALVEQIVDGRHLTPPATVTVTSACALLQRHRLWLCEQDWAGDAYAELKQLHRDVSNAVGIFRRPPVGRCHVVIDDAEKPCGGPLHPNDYGGVRCSRCGEIWNADALRLLGMAQNDAALEATKPA